jgi:hypothetical protein
MQPLISRVQCVRSDMEPYIDTLLVRRSDRDATSAALKTSKLISLSSVLTKNINILVGPLSLF